MKATKLFLLAAMLLATSTAWAQRYHDAENEQIKGQPKSVTATVEGRTLTTTFTQDGRLQQDGLSDAQYDADGWMTSCKVSEQGVSGTATMSYNAKRQLEKQVVSLSMGTLTTAYAYNDDGTLKQADITISAGPITQSTSVAYTYLTFDDHGSWTSRTAKSDQGPSTTETRTIEYW